MSTRNSPAESASGRGGKPKRPLGLSGEVAEDDDWEARDPDLAGHEIWEPAPFEFDDEEEPDPERGDFWLDPDDERDD